MAEERRKKNEEKRMNISVGLVSGKRKEKRRENEKFRGKRQRERDD